MSAVDAITTGQLQAVQLDSARRDIALLTLTQQLKRGTACPAWPAAVPRNFKERLLQNLGMPIARFVTQEEFVIAFDSCPTFSSEDLVRIFEVCRGSNESALPMESILKGFAKMAGSLDSAHLYRINQLRRTLRTRESDENTIDSEQLTPAQISRQEQKAPRSLPVVEIEPCMEDGVTDVECLGCSFSASSEMP